MENLRWPTDGLIERVNERIKKQIEKVEEMTGDMDAKTNFSLIIIQTELERWKYLVRGFLRARIAKVTPETNFGGKLYIFNMNRLTLLPTRLTGTHYTTFQPPKHVLYSQLRRLPMQLDTKHYYRTTTMPRFCHLSPFHCGILTTRPEASA